MALEQFEAFKACGGMPTDSDKGVTKACPVRYRCRRYAEAARAVGKLDFAPYDFDDSTCSEFLPISGERY